MKRFLLSLLFMFSAMGSHLMAGDLPTSDSDLLMAAARICMSGSRTHEDCSLLMEAGRRFDISQMSELIRMKENGETDTQNAKLRIISSALLDVAINRFGRLSREAITCRRVKMIATYITDNVSTYAYSETNMQDARALSSSNPDDLKLKELFILTQLEHLYLRADRELDNPLTWLETYRIEQQCDSLYQHLEAESDERVDIYNYLGGLKSSFTSYNDYLNVLYFEFYPEGSPVEAKMYDDLIWTSSAAYYQKAYEMNLRMYGKEHRATLSARLDCLNFLLSRNQIDCEEAHGELSAMLQLLRKDYPPSDDLSIKAELMMWECDIRNNSRLYETNRYNSLLFHAASYFGTNTESYLFTLNVVLGQRQRVQADQARALCSQSESLIREVYKNREDLMWRYLLELYTIKQETLDETAFQEYVSELIDHYSQHHRPTWASISFGKTLSYILNNFLYNYAAAADMYSLALGDLRQIVGNDHDLYAVAANECISYLIAAEHYEVAEHLCKQCLEKHYLNGQIEPTIYSQICDIYLWQDRYDEFKQYCERGIAASQRLEDKGVECYLQLKMADAMINNQEPEQAAQLFEKAIPPFMSLENRATHFTEGYFYISNYYQRTGQYEKALEVLQEGYQLYGDFFNVYDAQYVRFIYEIFELYSTQLNDFDRAEQFLEGHLRQMTLSPISNIHDEILQLLWMHYHILQQKEPENFVKTSALLQEIQRETVLVCGRTGNVSLDIIKKWMLPMLNEAISLITIYFRESRQNFSDLEKQIALAESAEYKEELNQMLKTARAQLEQSKSQIVDKYLPMSLQIEELMRTEDKDYMSSLDYKGLTDILSSIYFSVLNDSIEGEKWLRCMELSPNHGIRSQVLKNCGDYAIIKGNYAEAIKLLEESEAILKKEFPYILSNTGKLQFKNSLFWAYYNIGQKEKALALAREIHDLRSQLIRRNLNLMTESERNAFVSGGVTGNKLEILLPDFPEQLSGECYNSLLEEKGMLLRTASSIRKTILQSGDRTLISQLDSLDSMKGEYRQKSLHTNWQNGEYFFAKDITELNSQIELLERKLTREAAKMGADSIPIPTWQQVQQALKEGDAAIEFVHSIHETGALLLLPDGQAPRYIPLANSDSLYQEMDSISQLKLRRRVELMYQEDVLHLYERLWQPLTTMLRDSHRIYYSPTGYLNQLAFSAIRCPEGGNLIDHYELHQLTSTAEVTKPRQSRPQNIDAMLFGSVFYSPEQEEYAKEKTNKNSGQWKEDERGAILDDDEPFGFLTFTSDEANKVKAILESAHVATDLKDGFGAREEALAEVSGSSPYIIHLATHGFFLSSDEEVWKNKFLRQYPATRFSSMQRTGLAFVGGNSTWLGESKEPEAKDGILTAAEVSRLDFSKTGLAVLSACQTGTGFYTRDGVFGMHRGFKQAGVKSVLATLWNVNDKSTARLMELFYGKWLSGIPMQQSFNEAVIELRKEYPSPFFWAPFVLMDATE